MVDRREKPPSKVRQVPLAGSESSLGLRIKSIRLLMQIGQIEFSKRIGVSQSFLSDVEQGKSNASIGMLTNIALVYDEISRDWLITGRGHMLVGHDPEHFELWETARGRVVVGPAKDDKREPIRQRRRRPESRR